MVAGSWCDGERLIPTIFNCYIAGGRYRATGTGAGCEGVGIDSEARSHRDIGRHTGIGARVGRGVVAPVDEVVSCIGNGGNCRAAAAVADRLG